MYGGMLDCRPKNGGRRPGRSDGGEEGSLRPVCLEQEEEREDGTAPSLGLLSIAT